MPPWAAKHQSIVKRYEISLVAGFKKGEVLYFCTKRRWKRVFLCVAMNQIFSADQRAVSCRHCLVQSSAGAPCAVRDGARPRGVTREREELKSARVLSFYCTGPRQPLLDSQSPSKWRFAISCGSLGSASENETPQLRMLGTASKCKNLCFVHDWETICKYFANWNLLKPL